MSGANRAMKKTLLLCFGYTKAVLGKTILWLFVALDVIGLILEYAPLVLSQRQALTIPSFVYWGLAVIGFYWASFQVYRESRSNDVIGVERKTREQDKEFLKRLAEVMPSSGTISYLREYDFGGTFDFAWLGDLYKFIGLCKQPEFEFIDEELEKLKLELLDQAKNFADLVGKETFSSPSSGRLLSSIPKEMGHQNPEHYFALREALNSQAQKVTVSYDKLIRHARRKL
jgi:hypothetical protein